MRKTVNIRVDGNAVIGHGHIVRCQALAQMLYEQFDCRFFCQSIPESLHKELVSQEFSVELIREEDDFLKTLQPGELVVLDGYDFDYHYQVAVRERGVVLVLIDDLVSGNYFADAIINHAPGNRPSVYNALPETRFALGLKYALLREKYQQQAKTELPAGDPDTIFVCFGGADPQHLTLTAVRELIGSAVFKRIVVVTGTGFQATDSLKKLIDGNKTIEHYSGLSATMMIPLMLHCGVAMVPCSGMLFEALALKRIVISGRYIANQQQLYDQFKALHAFTDTGTFQPEEIHRALKEVREQPQPSTELIDGFAPFRFVNLFTELTNRETFYLRRALPEDTGTTYQWANDPVIRAHAFSQQPISPEAHESWFRKRLADPHCFYFLAIENDRAVGSIRFDLKGHEAVISYLLDPDVHGKGYGTRLLQLGMDRILTNKSFELRNITEITGFVLPANIPSVKSFEKLNFERSEAEDALKFSYRI
jgi:UDP-2,4-diacetamido-2,4,6-trideoxy-beta-L-altropyranose hydrolase